MKKSNLKVLTVVGTRPEIIRLSRVISLLDEHVKHIIVHTGQNYDYELNEIFFKDLELRKPDYFLNVNVSSLEASVGDIMRKSGEVLRKERPDALLVLGDTNSCLAAYMAKRLHIPIFHMEAGNRCFDFNVPEEINRRIVDHISDFNLVYTEHARRHLLSEGLPHRRIYLTGSPMFEVLNYYKPKILKSTILKDLSLSTKEPDLAPGTRNAKRKTRNYFVVSTHREENVDNPQNLNSILKILNILADKYKVPVIVSTHPRTRKRIEQLTEKKVSKLISFLKPFGFTDYVHLQMNALCTISDSGTISEESAILGFPAISLRNSMERPEAQDAGTIILTGFDPDNVTDSVELAIKENQHPHPKLIPAEYQVPDTSWRVLKLIRGVAGLSNKWHGIYNF
ncbi:MAG TPA: UDP-N-acetylglucosamine 2-epimerase (non-hydrolyzing) [Bacteroidales bacterium]|nr:UDP-N-acetylglucosamine 2-epimerase (non-hydrolyzing) [Bacteroidales bacterium]HQK68423.1 UDP-N-acetylglucosamine 2-epimerase (non-hydrolyzing) [Bacteroidales bacterium]